MSTVAFDTYAQVKQLVRTGVPEAQAEAIINIVAGATVLPDVSKLATKDDLASLRNDVTHVRTELKGDIDTLRLELKGEIDTLRFELKGDIDTLRFELKGDIDKLRLELKGDILGVEAKLNGLKGELIWWILGAVGFTAAFPQILQHLPK